MGTKYKMELNRIKFEISLRFDECDVDAVFAKNSQWAPHFHDVEGSSTPTEESVANYLYILSQEDFGKAEVKEWYELMMAFCSVTFEVDPDEVSFEELPAIVENCKRIMRRHMGRIGYYKNKTTVGHSCGFIGVSG